MMRILILGGADAGPKAAARARRLMPEADITIVERGALVSYAACGFPSFAGGQTRDFDQLLLTSYGVVRDSEYFADEKAIRVLTRTEATAIDRKRREVAVTSLDSGEKYTLPYDKLVLATGAVLPAHPAAGRKRQGVYYMDDPDDVRHLAADAGQAKQAVILGGGRTGLEAADALLKHKLWVCMVEPADQLLPGLLDRQLALLLAYRLEEEGLEFYAGRKVLHLDSDGGRVTGVVTDQESLEADLVVVATEPHPNAGLAREAGLRLGPTGAVAVDRHLLTSDPDIYAIGSCAETRSLISGRPVYFPLAATANRQARVAGDNLAGTGSTFEGMVGTAVLKIASWNVGRTGLGEEEARSLGWDAAGTVAANHDRSHFFPGHDNVILKLVVEKGSRRLLGAQGVGQGDVVKRIDVAATAISLDGTADQLASVDLGYAPPYNTPADPLQQTADIVRNKLDGTAETVTAAELRERLASAEDFVLLDVRTAQQFQYRHIADPRTRQIALGELRRRLADIPRDKPVIAVCPLGTRAYEAACILAGAGFRNAAFLEGGLQAWPWDLE